MNQLPYELALQIASNLDLPSILRLCQSSTSFSQICKDDFWWLQLFSKNYGVFMNSLPNNNWKQHYIQAYNNVLINSPDFITVFNIIKQHDPNVKFYNHDNQRITMYPYISRGNTVFFRVFVPSLGRLPLIKALKKLNISTNSYIIGGIGYVLAIDGFIGNDELWYFATQEMVEEYFRSIIGSR